MFTWRAQISDTLRHSALLVPRAKHTYTQRYEKILMRWGSGLFWIYIIQCLTGLTLSINYTPIFDTGMLTVIFLWWETSHGSILVRLHSEVANLLFLFLYMHLFTKLWTSIDMADATSQTSWVSGTIILIFTYVAGVTGAIMPCSTLSEVTATIVGSMLASLVYVKFDFLETLLVPGVALNEETIFRVFVVHALIPLLTLIIGLIHMVTLHIHKYSAGGGFKRLAVFPRFRETRRWSYANRYWTRSSGTWIRMLCLILFTHIFNELLKLKSQVVSYSFMNSEYWPINETIDFVLIIPHWYLRPLMGALVAIPHHYLGFIYIGAFFIFIVCSPWANDTSGDSVWTNQDEAATNTASPARWTWAHSAVASSFLFSAIFTTAIIPTGKYFIACGSMDGLIFAYWTLLVYLAGAAQFCAYYTRKTHAAQAA